MRAVTLEDYKRRLLRVLVHIQGHLDERLRLEELAGLACFSPCHFHRVFTGMVGESVKEHVRRLRLERAATQLKLGTAPVTSIAFDAGYESHEAFTRSFRAAFGLSPSQFRSSKQTPHHDRCAFRAALRARNAVRRFQDDSAGRQEHEGED